MTYTLEVSGTFKSQFKRLSKKDTELAPTTIAIPSCGYFDRLNDRAVPGG